MLYTPVFNIKLNYNNGIKKGKFYSSNFYVKTSVLIMKKEYKFASKPNTSICEALGMTTEIICSLM